MPWGRYLKQIMEDYGASPVIRLACASLSCDGFIDNDFKGTFRLLPELGYHYVELNLWHPGSLIRTRIVDLRKRCDDHKLTPVAVYGVTFGTLDGLHKDVTHKLRMLEVALELGCRRIVATGARGRPEGGLEAVIRVLEHVVPEAEGQGVDICLENHHNHSIDTPEDYEAIFGAVSSKCVGMCVDTGHFVRSGVDLATLVARFGSRINHVHLKDFLQGGRTDNHGFLRRLLDTPYRGFLTVEHPPRDEGSIKEDLSIAKEVFARYER